MQCAKDHYCYMCDDHANGGNKGTCKICYKVTELRKATCELCLEQQERWNEKQKDPNNTEATREKDPINTNVDWDTSFKRDLDGSTCTRDGPFKRVICYTCAKGEKGDWIVPVRGYAPRKVLRHHQC